MILESEGNEQVDFMTRVKYIRKKEIKKVKDQIFIYSFIYFFYIFFFFFFGHWYLYIYACILRTRSPFFYSSSFQLAPIFQPFHFRKLISLFSPPHYPFPFLNLNSTQLYFRLFVIYTVDIHSTSPYLLPFVRVRNIIATQQNVIKKIRETINLD
jgi:hypothetical protein